MKDEIKLLPCPFCGSEEIKHCERFITGDGVREYDGYAVWCGPCGVERNENTKEEAFEAWNKRAPSPNKANAEICSNTVCDYCEDYCHEGNGCTSDVGCNGAQGFKGRKLRVSQDS